MQQRSLILGYIGALGLTIAACGGSDNSGGSTRGGGTGGQTASGGMTYTGGVAGSGGSTTASGGYGAYATGGSGGYGGYATGGSGGTTGGSGGVTPDGGGPDGSLGLDGGVGTDGSVGPESGAGGGSGGAGGSGGGADSGGSTAPGTGCGSNPPVLVTTVDSSNTLLASKSANTSDYGNLIGGASPSACPAGAGPDVVYSLQLDRTRDLTVKLTPTFDGVLRVFGGACDPASELGCSNQASGTAAEQVDLVGLAAGTYYVAVDGATSADKGTFDLAVTAPCNAVEGLRIVEVGIGAIDYTILENTANCPARLQDVTVLFDDSQASDLSLVLPSTLTLQPGEILRIDESVTAPSPGVVGTGGSAASINFAPTKAGSIFLCHGDCSAASQVLDQFSFLGTDAGTAGATVPPSLAGVTFSTPVSGINDTNQDTASWVRVAYAGTNPTFTGADWCVGKPAGYDALRLHEVHVAADTASDTIDYVVLNNRASCPVQLANFQLYVQNAMYGKDSGTNRSSTIPLGSWPAQQPTVAGYASLCLSRGALAGCKDVTGISNSLVPLVRNYAGFAMLCRGACTFETPGVQVIDLIGMGGTDTVGADGVTNVTAPLPLPGILTFKPNWIPAISDPTQAGTQSYRRAAFAGVNPRFLQADWVTGARQY